MGDFKGKLFSFRGKRKKFPLYPFKKRKPNWNCFKNNNLSNYRNFILTKIDVWSEICYNTYSKYIGACHMRKSFIFLALFCLLLSSCSNGTHKDYTAMEVAKYISEMNGIKQLDDEVYEIPCGDDFVYVAAEAYTELVRADKLRYLGICLESLLCNKELYPDNQYHYSSIFNDMNSEDTYLGDTSNFAYTLEKYKIHATPEWTEWIEYNIPEYVHSEAHGKFNLYWYNPLTEEYEKCIYIRENGSETEIYVIFFDISFFYGINKDEVAPYLMSEKMYTELQSQYEDEDIDFSVFYKKGTVTEFSNWFMGEYSENSHLVFEDIKEDVYYPINGAPNYGSIFESRNEAISTFVSDLESLGVNFDKLTAQIIKVTVPHNGDINNISFELIRQ